MTITSAHDTSAAAAQPTSHSGERLVRRAMLDTYLMRVIDRDLPGEGVEVRRPETLRRWLAAYAAASTTTTRSVPEREREK